MNFETTKEIELAVAHYFDIRQKTIIPNISWGLNIHECDLLILTNSGYATEIEIKVSKSDLKADMKKLHHQGHYEKKIKYLYFAIPEKLEKDIQYIPKHAGIIKVSKTGYIDIIRPPIYNNKCRKLTTEEQLHFMKLGCIRIWKFKYIIKNLHEQLKSLKMLKDNHEIT